MRTFNEINVIELSSLELQQVDGGTLSKNEARVVAFLLGGVIGLGLFELSASLPR